MRPTTKRRAIISILITGIMICVLYWLFSPTLRIKVEANVAEIDLQNLGEYHSVLYEIVIRDLTDRRVIWHAKPKNDFIAVFKILLHSGNNPLDLGLSQTDPNIEIIEPLRGSTVEFASGHRYRVEIRGRALFWGRFVLPKRQEFVL